MLFLIPLVWTLVQNDAPDPTNEVAWLSNSAYTSYGPSNIVSGYWSVDHVHGTSENEPDIVWTSVLASLGGGSYQDPLIPTGQATVLLPSPGVFIKVEYELKYRAQRWHNSTRGTNMRERHDKRYTGSFELVDAPEGGGPPPELD